VVQLVPVNRSAVETRLRFSSSLSVYASAFAKVLYDAGEAGRARQMAILAVDRARHAGPIVLDGILTVTAASWLLNGDTDEARSALVEALRIARDEGFTVHVLNSVFVASALVARGGDLETLPRSSRAPPAMPTPSASPVTAGCTRARSRHGPQSMRSPVISNRWKLASPR
jgi:hypothetical protein